MIHGIKSAARYYVNIVRLLVGAGVLVLGLSSWPSSAVAIDCDEDCPDSPETRDDTGDTDEGSTGPVTPDFSCPYPYEKVGEHCVSPFDETVDISGEAPTGPHTCAFYQQWDPVRGECVLDDPTDPSAPSGAGGYGSDLLGGGGKTTTGTGGAGGSPEQCIHSFCCAARNGFWNADTQTCTSTPPPPPTPVNECQECRRDAEERTALVDRKKEACLGRGTFQANMKCTVERRRWDGTPMTSEELGNCQNRLVIDYLGRLVNTFHCDGEGVASCVQGYRDNHQSTTKDAEGVSIGIEGPVGPGTVLTAGTVFGGGTSTTTPGYLGFYQRCDDRYGGEYDLSDEALVVCYAENDCSVNNTQYATVPDKKKSTPPVLGMKLLK